MNVLRGILIDPFSFMLSEVTVEGTDKTICAAMAKVMQCEYVQRVCILENEYVWVDENGVLGDWDKQGWFRWAGSDAAPMAGRALVLGSDAEGEPASTTLTIRDLAPHIIWVRPEEVRMPAPKMITSAGVEFLDGVEEWTYDRQPHRG